jgi:CheY-like chemotaxis protein
MKTANPPMRKVLTIEDVPSVRKALLTLLADLRYEADAADSGRQAIDIIRWEKFDAVLLDIRCAHALAEEVVPSIRSLQPSLLANVLVITAEVADAKTLDLLEWYFELQVHSKGPIQYVVEAILWGLMHLPPVPNTA